MVKLIKATQQNHTWSRKVSVGICNLCTRRDVKEVSFTIWRESIDHPDQSQVWNLIIRTPLFLAPLKQPSNGAILVKYFQTKNSEKPVSCKTNNWKIFLFENVMNDESDLCWIKWWLKCRKTELDFCGRKLISNHFKTSVDPW